MIYAEYLLCEFIKSMTSQDLGICTTAERSWTLCTDNILHPRVREKLRRRPSSRGVDRQRTAEEINCVRKFFGRVPTTGEQLIERDVVFARFSQTTCAAPGQGTTH